MPLEMSDEYVRDCQRKQAREQKMASICGFAKCLGLIVGYSCFGVYYYGTKEGWNTIDCLYFTAVTMTTIGYGDLKPTTWESKLVTIAFAMVGIGIMFGSGAKLGDWLLARQDQLALQALARMKMKVNEREENERQKRANAGSHGPGIKMDKPRKSCAQHVKSIPTYIYELIMWIISTAFKLAQTIDRLLDDWLPGQAVLVKKIGQCLAPLVMYMFVGCIIGLAEGWGLSTSLYFAAMTVTTIGYGDFSPTRASSRAFAIIYCPLAVLVVGNVAVHLRQVLQSAKLKDMSLFKILRMDADGNGRVHKEEYMAAVLLSMGQARKSTIELINTQFDYLDGDGSGYLDKDDLARLQELKITSLQQLLHLDELLEKEEQARAEKERAEAESQVAGSQAQKAATPKMVV